MKCYRFKHIPTGLYYRPSSEVRVTIKNPDGSTRIWMRVKTNLSKKGKIYPQTPSWRWINGGYYNHVYTNQKIVTEVNTNNITQSEVWGMRNRVYPFVQSEWVMEEL